MKPDANDGLRKSLPDSNRDLDREFNTMGFENSKSRRSLFYVLFTTLMGIIFVLARQVVIEQKRAKAAEDRNVEWQKDMQERLFNIVTDQMREPKEQIKEAAAKVDTAATKVKTVAEKLNNKTKK